MTHPRDRFITVYGRKPVLEALEDSSLEVDKVVLAHQAQGAIIDEIVRLASRRRIPLEWANERYVTRLSRNGRQDQGAVCDLKASRMAALETWLADAPERADLMLLDGVNNPANLGLLLRTTTAAGLAGVVLPRLGCPEVSPLVIKASAGVALKAPILRTESALTAAQALTAAGFELLGLRGVGAEDLFTAPLSPRTVLVLGNETLGISPEVAPLIRRYLSIPMAGGVESLNAAMAGGVAAFELCRRRRTRDAEARS